MHCHDAKRHLWQYLDQEIEPGLHRRITAHLDRCDECLVRFRGEEAVELAVSRSMLQAPASPRLWARIDAALDSADSQVLEKARPSRRPWLLIAAAAAVLAGIFVYRGAFVPEPLDPESVARIPELPAEVARLHDRASSGQLQPEIRTADWSRLDPWALQAQRVLGFRWNGELKKGCVPGLELVGLATATVRGEPVLVIFALVEASKEPVHLLVFAQGSVDRFPHTRDFLSSGRTREVAEGSLHVAARQTDEFLVAGVGRVPGGSLQPFVDGLFVVLRGQSFHKND